MIVNVIKFNKLLSSRFDPSSFKSLYSFTSKQFDNQKLSSVAFINPTVKYDGLKDDDEISFVPMEIVDEFEGKIVEKRIKKISETKGFTKFIEGDLLWAKITPCMQNGKSAIARDLEYKLGCGSTEFYVIRPKNDKILVEYLHFLLRDKRVLDSAQSFFGGSAGQQRVSVDFLKNFNVPVIPINLQERIIALVYNANKIKQIKEKQAQNIILSIKNYLINELGIAFSDKTLERSLIVKSSNILGNRLDPFNYLHLGSKTKNEKFKCIPLKNIANLSKGQSITKDKISEGKYPVIAGGQSSPYTHEEFNQEENVITVSASGAYSGYVWHHNYKIFASDCTVIRSKNEKAYLSKYIYEVLKVKQEEIYMLQKGAGQPHVYASDLEKILIPDVEIDMQIEIVNHINDLRLEAQSCILEGEEALDIAKKEVERIILEGK